MLQNVLQFGQHIYSISVGKWIQRDLTSCIVPLYLIPENKTSSCPPASQCFFNTSLFYILLPNGVGASPFQLSVTT
jgi:hypothetical protein